MYPMRNDAWRRLHHSRFFSQSIDYGHAKFLDQLTNQKIFVTKALERLERRTAEVCQFSAINNIIMLIQVFIRFCKKKNQQWFKWVRECQGDEEANREKEQKKIKQETQLWQKNWKQAKQRTEEKMRRKEKMKQDAFLEKLCKDKMKEIEDESANDEMNWDPIEDELEDGRGNFIGMFILSPQILHQQFKVDISCNTYNQNQLTINGKSHATFSMAVSRRKTKLRETSTR